MVLKKQLRMTTRDFSVTRRPLQQASTDHFSIKIFPGVGAEMKYAVVVSAKVALTATMRNRFRRQISELLRTGSFPIQKNRHIVIIVRRSLPQDTKTVQKELATALEKSGILNR